MRLLLLLVLSCVGCKTAGGQAFTACELGHLGSAGETAFATVHDIADNPGSTVADLESAALSLAPGQLDCAVQAVLAWINSLSSPSSPNQSAVQAVMSAHTDVIHDHAKQVLTAYLAAHKK